MKSMANVIIKTLRSIKDWVHGFVKGNGIWVVIVFITMYRAGDIEDQKTSSSLLIICFLILILFAEKTRD